jgi:hypothetical protein
MNSLRSAECHGSGIRGGNEYGFVKEKGECIKEVLGNMEIEGSTYRRQALYSRAATLLRTG